MRKDAGYGASTRRRVYTAYYKRPRPALTRVFSSVSSFLRSTASRHYARWVYPSTRLINTSSYRHHQTPANRTPFVLETAVIPALHPRSVDKSTFRANMSSLEASQTAVADSIVENKVNGKNGENELEPGEIQEVEVDMQAHAESIRTVFNDPTNFNVKVSISSRIVHVETMCMHIVVTQHAHCMTR